MSPRVALAPDRTQRLIGLDMAGNAAEGWGWRFWGPRSGRLAIGTIISICLLGWADPALAYRPFDGTDAAVADVGELEIEFEPAGILRSGSQNTTTGPYAIFNYGFADRWELVVQGQGHAFPPDSGPTPVSNGVFLKYVMREGALQEKSGPSIATEFGTLLPNFGGSGVGFGWAGIVSQRWDWGTVHLNFATNLTPEQEGELFLDTIIEGPHKWKVRPVLELYYDNVFNHEQTYSALIGAIWQVTDKLSFDVGLRHALVNGRPVDELRAGVTFGFALISHKPAH
jgi:hypothetical protein